MTGRDEHEDSVMDARLRELARGYNEPPAVPRDEMWAAIAAGIGSVPGTSAGTAPADVRPIRGVRRVAPWMAMAAAAVLLVALGIGIGRRSVLDAPGANPGAVMARGDSNAPAQPDSSARDAGAADVAGTPEQRLASAETGDAPRGAAVDRATRPEGRGAARGAPESGAERSAAASDTRAYAVAAVRHLTEVEALLTAFRGEPSREADAQIAGWARRLLSDTRLLMDSPAARDPLRRRLLEDLELVLVQIVQISPEAAQQERRLIEGSMNRDQVLTRLRSAIPAGPTSGA